MTAADALATLAPSERALVALLAAALAPTPVYWGWAPFETANEAPTLPLVVVQRQSFTSAEYEDMCGGPYVGDKLVGVNAWALTYEAARALAAAARDAMSIGAEGWRLQQEVDIFEPAFRAWCISGSWLAGGVPPDA